MTAGLVRWVELCTRMFFDATFGCRGALGGTE